MHAVGLIDRLPRLAVIQAAGAAPFAAYHASGFEEFAPVQAETVATAIKIGNPASTARPALDRVDNGWVTTVGDDEILDAKAAIDRSGIGCEPASAASLAGCAASCEDGIVGSTRPRSHSSPGTFQRHRRGHRLPLRRRRRRSAPRERTGRSASRPSFPRWSRLSPMRFTVRTPASSANLGPGFDALGLALGLWNEATIDPSGEPGRSPCGVRRPVCSMAARTWR